MNRIAYRLALCCLAAALAGCAGGASEPPRAPAPAPALPAPAASSPAPTPTPSVAPSPAPVADPLIVISGRGRRGEPATLADAARSERERRRKTGEPATVIDDQNLKQYAEKGQLTVASGGPEASPEREAAVAELAAQEAAAEYWRGRVLTARLRWREAVEQIQELEGELAELRRRFYAEDDPYVRDGRIKPAWDRSLDLLAAAQQEVQEAKDDLRDALEDGRLAGALPGWLREGIEHEPEPLPEPPPPAEPGEPRVVGEGDDG